MAIETPENAVEIDKAIRADFARVVEGSRPFVRNSWWGGTLSALAHRMFDFFVVFDDAQDEAIPDTAVVTLPRQAAVRGVTQLGATQASGPTDMRGTIGTVVPVDTIYKSGDGTRYATDIVATMAAISLTVPAAGLERTESTVTLTLANDHGLGGAGAGFELKLVGTDEPLYNLNPLPDLVITGLKTLTFTAAAGASPAGGGTLELANVAGGQATIDVTAESPGQSGNQLANAALALDQTISGMLELAHVTQVQIGGGADQETTEAFRDRYLEVLRDPAAHFNDPDIIQTCKEVNGVTRVFVERRTPALGQVTIYFVRDLDSSIFPTPGEIDDVETALLGGTVGGIEFPGIIPSDRSLTDVIVLAPSDLQQFFVFDALVPDTPTMRQAVTDNLLQFFQESVTVGVDVLGNQYKAAIQLTVDVAGGGLPLVSFNLIAPGPTGDISVSSGELPTFQDANFDAV